MNKTKVLIVEDEAIVALDLKRSLEKFGYEVTGTASNYDQAIQSVRKNRPNIMIMDVDLGKKSKDGIQTVEDIQKLAPIPVIFLTAFSDSATMKRVLSTYPAAYLVKPLNNLEELKTTIELSLHKLKPKEFKDTVEEMFVHLGFDYYYDLRNHHLFYKDDPVKLSSKEQVLFKVLVEAKGTIVPFNELEFNIWPDGPVSNSALRTLTYRLRQKLECDLIETIPYFGCKLINSL